MHKRKPYAVVIITVIGFSFAVVQLFAFDLLGYRGESPGGALLIVELFPSLLAQLFLGDELAHAIRPFMVVCLAPFGMKSARHDNRVRVETSKPPVCACRCGWVHSSNGFCTSSRSSGFCPWRDVPTLL